MFSDKSFGYGGFMPLRSFLAFAFLALVGCTTTLSPSRALGIDPFYTQYLSARGIPVVASARVSPRALSAARSMAEEMTAHRPDLARVLAERGYRIAVMGPEEALLDLPEMRHWRKPAPGDPRLTRCEIKHYEARIGRLTDRQYWDARARGIGGRHMVAAEEDLLGLHGNRYFGETIFVHEFSHQILDAVRIADPELYRLLEAAYAAAKAAGRWREEYTMTTVDEYWAEGTQFWFGSNRLQVFDGRRILEREDLKAYDPALFMVLQAVFGDVQRLSADPFHKHPARVPPGPPPVNTAEVC